jgi:uroporphyrinogen-III synthase
MTKTILITRPRGDGETLAETLQQQGLHIICEPLTEIILHHQQRHLVEAALMTDPNAVIVTSRHGARALAALTELRDPYILAVGEATAEAAESLGFVRVAAAGGNVQQLIKYIEAGYDEGAHFLYVSGKHVRSDLAEALEPLGMEVDRVVVYEAVAAESLSDTLTEQLRRGQIDGVTFLSPRAAEIFNTLLAKAGLEKETTRLEAFCLSEAVAEKLERRRWRAVCVSTEPTLASPAASIDNI